MMALTATATRSTRQAVVRVLKMVHPEVVSISPNKLNIKYYVKMNVHTLEETLAPLVEELRQKRRMDRTIVFCRTYDQCTRIYMLMASRLGWEMMEPIDLWQDLSQFRLVDMFSACTHPSVKETILRTLPDSNGILRVIVATIAFWHGFRLPQYQKGYPLGPFS